VPSPPKMNK